VAGGIHKFQLFVFETFGKLPMRNGECGCLDEDYGRNCFMQPLPKKFFVIHSRTSGGAVIQKLKPHLPAEPLIREWSILNSGDEGDPRSKIGSKIEWCDVLIVFITQATQASEFVALTVKYARELNKRIIGIWDDEGGEDCGNVPALEEMGDAVAPFGEQILAACTGELTDLLDRTGSARAEREIARVTCK
jgi:hypothetical protein